MTGYVVHYRYGLTNMTQSVPPSSTHVEILDLTECYNYTFSVEATSEHLSGMSNNTDFELGIVSMIQKLKYMLALHYFIYCLEVFFFLSLFLFQVQQNYQ